MVTPVPPLSINITSYKSDSASTMGDDKAKDGQKPKEKSRTDLVGQFLCVFPPPRPVAQRRHSLMPRIPLMIAFRSLTHSTTIHTSRR